ncbi:histidine kinase [Natronomonas moolapensis 8.8.11]|uniref:histidine kinase n=1 Tax=Natronomonas moolapensis (strain DSM 18674 / CECT 7526 / JCM 14361 / 8.8.11) TaxID=268739 RepID=M1XS72_NATM8|nr:HAMP domain-containing sensor histidine kinase [Natronomonas moolapensis]CCQ37183.1 histidine kinase [Natronomonas moolapensis 8.8.11]
MQWFERIPLVTPLRGAVIYVICGFVWIGASDQLLFVITPSARTLTILQTIKGSAFVVSSGGLIYIIAKAQYLQLEQLTDRIRTEIQHVSILHRILRHNLRNQASIIDGHLSEITPHVPDAEQESIREMETALERLVDLSDKMSRLNNELSGGDVARATFDLGACIGDAADAARPQYPDARIETDLPEEEMPVVGPRAFEWVLDELLENAVVHNDKQTPQVSVSAAESADGKHATVRVSDNGPGMPPVERRLALDEPETPLEHSEGAGLWVTRLLVTLSGGAFDIRSGDTPGTTIEITLPTPDAA